MHTHHDWGDDKALVVTIWALDVKSIIQRLNQGIPEVSDEAPPLRT